MTLASKTDKEEPIVIAAFDGNNVTVHVEKPYAPGQPMKLVVPIEPACEVEGRTIGAKRLTDGLFEIRLRVISLTRDVRERWLEAMSDSRRA